LLLLLLSSSIVRLDMDVLSGFSLTWLSVLVDELLPLCVMFA
jgi:hypothetical protein